ncbi:hypothetical protein V8E54_007628 [Elaphomyces granulatus]
MTDKVILDYCSLQVNPLIFKWASTRLMADTVILDYCREQNFDQVSQEGCWMVPFERNPRFLGRHNEDCEQGLRKIAITGLGGVGKTQIALEIAYQIRDKKLEFSIFWIPATSVEKIEQAYMGIGERLRLQDGTPADMKKAVKDHLSSEKTGPWLLIIDNLDDMNMWTTSDPSSPVLKTYIPQTQTTTQLLCQLGCLPLAIIQAASYMNQTGVSVATYLSLLERQENEIVELLSQDFEDEWRYAESKNPVAVTWLISFHQIQRLNSLTEDYLSFMSCIDPRDILITQIALGLLKAYSFITGQADDQTLSLHRLVHLAMLQSGGMLEQWTVNTGKRVREILPSSAHENRILWRKYLPHALFVLQSKGFQNDTRDREYLVQMVAKCLQSDGRYHEAGVLFKEDFEKKRKKLTNDDERCSLTVLGPGHPNTLTSMHNLASTYHGRKRKSSCTTWHLPTENRDDGGGKAICAMMETEKTVLGRWTEVEKLSVQVMETRKTVLGPEHPDTLTSMHNLASTYRDQGRWTEAEKLLSNLSHTLKGLSRHAVALSLLQDCVQLREQRLGPGSHSFFYYATACLKAWQEEHSIHPTGR